MVHVLAADFGAFCPSQETVCLSYKGEFDWVSCKSAPFIRTIFCGNNKNGNGVTFLSHIEQIKYLVYICNKLISIKRVQALSRMCLLECKDNGK